MKVTNPIWAAFGNNSISEKENCGLKYTISYIQGNVLQVLFQWIYLDIQKSLTSW